MLVPRNGHVSGNLWRLLEKQASIVMARVHEKTFDPSQMFLELSATSALQCNDSHRKTVFKRFDWYFILLLSTPKNYSGHPKQSTTYYIPISYFAGFPYEKAREFHRAF